MIVTFTANPSVDKTAPLESPIEPGEVHRLGDVLSEPGGKGVNVSRAVHLAGHPTVAVVPAPPGDPLLGMLDDFGVPYRQVFTDKAVRTNLAVTGPDGTTTKFNEAGAPLTSFGREALVDALREESSRAKWVALCGSLPPQAPSDWYLTLVKELGGGAAKIAVDTSGTPLRRVAEGFSSFAPYLLKPNSYELGELVGVDGAEFEEQVEAGRIDAVRRAVTGLHRKGVALVLATFGRAGAVLCGQGNVFLHARVRAANVRSTVGAGDASLAGFLVAFEEGSSLVECLVRSVAYGAAAVSLPGSQMPGPDDIDMSAVTVENLSR